MSLSNPSRPKRISLTLDPSLVLERLMMRRLADLPRMRRLDWLRALLAQGFLIESRLLRVGAPDAPVATLSGGTPKTEARVTDWSGRLPAITPPRPASSEPCAPVPQSLPVPSEHKPFAHLGRVIG